MSELTHISDDDHLFIGTDRTLQFLVKDANGAYINLSAGSYEMEFVVKKERDDTLALITKTTVAGITISSADGGTNNAANVRLSVSDTQNLNPGLYHYTLRKTNTNDRDVLAFGTLTLMKAA